MSIDPQPATFPDFHRFELSADGLGRYDVLVGLPAGYADSTTRYPVIYLTDGPHWFWNVFGTMRFLALGQLAPAAIIVAVGYPSDEGHAGFASRRHYDFTPGPWDMNDELGVLLRDAITDHAASHRRPGL